MPWKDMRPMDQKVQLIADWQTLSLSKTDLSKRYGVSRKTVHKWINRYKKIGIDGLKDHYRAPWNSPYKTSEEKIRFIIEEKLRRKKRGPKKIKVKLEECYPDIEWPAPSTIGHLLKRYGLVEKRKKRLRVPPYTEPFIDCREPNAVWSADYKGQFHTRDHYLCYPLTLSDNYSRYLLRCEALLGPRYQETQQVFEEAFREYGLPNAIRYDNGTPFAGKGVGGLSRLSIWWIQLGIIPERIEKGCPEQNGRHERMHRTLKAEVLDSVAKNLQEQQGRFNFFQNDYNYDRPHEALNQKPPASRYRKSGRPFVKNPVIPDYDLGYEVRMVRQNGEIKFEAETYYLSELLGGQPVGLKRTNETSWEIYYSFLKLGVLDIRQNKIMKLT